MSPSRRLLVAFVLGLPVTIASFWLLFVPDLGDGLIYLQGVVRAYAGADFVNMWLGARLAWSGNIAALFDFEQYNTMLRAALSPHLPFHNWSYPPHLLLLLAPLAWLPYPLALLAWSVATFSAFAWSIWPAHRFADQVAYKFAIVALPATLINLVEGQTGFLTAALLIGGQRLMHSRPWVAGVLFGLLTVKPQLGIVVPFALIALGLWRPFVTAAVSALGLVAVTAAIFGPDVWHNWYTITAPYQQALISAKGLFFHQMMPTPHRMIYEATGQNGLAMVMQGVVALAAIVLMAVVLRRSMPIERQIAVITLCGALLSPYFVNYDLVAASGGLLFWFGSQQSVTSRDIAWALPTFFAPALTLLLGFAGLPVAALLLMASYAWLLQMAPDPRRVGAELVA